MWCTNCQSDVAAEVSTDSKRVHCAICGTDLGTTAATRISDKTREARDLLARWSNREILDPYGPVTKLDSRSPSPSSLADQFEDNTKPIPEQPETKNQRVEQPSFPDPEHKAREDSLPQQTPAFADQDSVHHTSESLPFQQAVVPQFHTDYRDIQDLIEEDDRSPNWLGLVGQLMAYGGVAVLTIGTTLILWGYYGGPANYASTGWLISTAGQMLLFLGVITLVSAGMEQSSASVTRRIDRLGQRIYLFEKAMLEQQKTQQNQPVTPEKARTHSTDFEQTTRKSA